MARKTVINAICKIIIDSSDDSALFTGDDENADRPKFDATQIANTGQVVDIPQEEPIQTAQEVHEEPVPTEPEPVEQPKVKAGKGPGF